jgi:hypothetical protein
LRANASASGSTEAPGVTNALRTRSPKVVPPGSRVTTSACPADPMRRASEASSVDLPLPSIPSTVMNS